MTGPRPTRVVVGPETVKRVTAKCRRDGRGDITKLPQLFVDGYEFREMREAGAIPADMTYPQFEKMKDRGTGITGIAGRREPDGVDIR